MVGPGIGSLMAENLSDVWKEVGCPPLSAAALLIEPQLGTTQPSIDLIVAGRPPFVGSCLVALGRALTGLRRCRRW